MSDKTIKLIWQTSGGAATDFEFEWITKDLYSKVNQEHIMDCGSLQTVCDGATIIYSTNRSNVDDSFLEYLNKFTEAGYKFNLLHLSNEDLNHDDSYYSKAQNVIRNYYGENFKASNITFIPLGYQSGYKNYNDKISPVSERTIPVVFIGQPKSDRHDLIESLHKIQDSMVYTINGWKCSTSLSQESVSKIYSKTKYVPCPRGWVHIDSFRIFEALEWGAVPVLKNYPEKLGWIDGGHPLPVVNEWSDLSDLIANTNYESLQTKCQDWYKSIKNDLSDKIAHLSSNLFA
jgi:hypothetical protein